MTWSLAVIGFLVLIVGFLFNFIVHPLYLSPLSKIPGPRLYAVTQWRIALDEWNGTRTKRIDQLHQRYGPVVRIGPNEVHFNSLSALRTIYGAGSGFERTEFYRMFDVYGKQNVFTFGPSYQHAERKKLLAHSYAKSNTIRGPVAEEIERKVQDYLNLIEATQGEGNEIFQSLHWYSLDNITNFLYGPDHGGTSALKGNSEHQRMLDDILDPARCRLSWFMLHFPTPTKWLYARTGLAERLFSFLLPMQKPATYTRIREHALQAMQDFKAAQQSGKLSAPLQNSVINQLWQHHESKKNGGLGDLDIASECSDHFLAGIDTTSDTLMFAIWALSLPQNREHQDRLIEEARSIQESGLNDDGNPTVETLDKLPYLDAVLKETLRLYAPIPASEPRRPPRDTEIDGYHIPAWTIVSMAPYSLHRNPEIFPDPLKFNPERWLGDTEQVAQMKKWWWAFSSGGRMCIGMHLGMAEMVVLPAIYRRYSTRIRSGSEGVSPGITSRFEVFSDENFEQVAVSRSQFSQTRCGKADRRKEHTCWIQFRPFSQQAP